MLPFCASSAAETASRKSPRGGSSLLAHLDPKQMKLAMAGDALGAAARRPKTPEIVLQRANPAATKGPTPRRGTSDEADPTGVDVALRPRTPIEEALGCDFVRERFVVGANAGSGAFSACFFAEDRVAARDVVLKVTNIAKKEHATMCLREAAVLKSISHPAIVGLYGEHIMEAYHIVVMEALHGPELHDLIKARGALKETYVRVVARDVASGLSHLHRRGVLHRDVKPDNVICVGSSKTADDHLPTRCVLIDFGLARTLSPADIDAAGFNQEELDKSLSRLAIDMSAVGNRHYSAPEIKNCALKTYPEALAPCTSSYGIAADAYALGKTLSHALTGRIDPLTGVELLCGFICRGGRKAKRRTYADLRCVSEECAAAVRGLLKARPEQRTKLRQFLVSPWVASADAPDGDELTSFAATPQGSKAAWADELSARRAAYDEASTRNDAGKPSSSSSSFHLLECALDLSARRRSSSKDSNRKGRQAPVIELSSSTPHGSPARPAHGGR